MAVHDGEPTAAPMAPLATLRIRAEGRLERIETLIEQYEFAAHALSNEDWAGRLLGRVPAAVTDADGEAARGLIRLPGGPAYVKRLNEARRRTEHLAAKHLRHLGWAPRTHDPLAELAAHLPVHVDARHISRVLRYKGHSRLHADRAVMVKAGVVFAVATVGGAHWLGWLGAALGSLVLTGLVVPVLKTEDFLVMTQRGLATVDGTAAWSDVRSASMTTWRTAEGEELGTADFAFLCAARILSVRWQGNPQPVLEALRQHEISVKQDSMTFVVSDD